MFIRSFFYKIMLIVLFALNLNAQTSDMYEQKSKIEKMISERMKNTIATNLDKNLFDVSVSVKLNERKNIENSKNEKSTEEQVIDASNIEDLQMGLVNTQDLIKTYQKEIEDLQLAKKNANPTKKDIVYEISSIQVSVGLSDKLDDAYLSQFTTWLNGRVKSEFGKLGKSSVNRIKTKLPDKQVKTPIDYLKDFQLALAALLGILGIILGIIMFKMIKSKDAEAERQMQLQLSGQTQQAKPDVPAINGQKAENKKSDITKRNDNRATRELTNKLINLIIHGNVDINNVVDYWLTSDDNGFVKTACLFDSLLEYSSRASAGAPEAIELLKTIRIATAFKARIAETLAKMSQIAIDEKIILLDSSYWDVLSFQTVGDDSFKKPFGYVSQTEPKVMKAILMQQTSKMRSIIVLNLPQQFKSRIVSELNSNEKRELFEQSIQTSEIEKNELDTISDAIKYQISNDKKQEQTVRGLELLPSLLSTFSPYEEMSYICDSKQKSKKLIEQIMPHWPTLALIELWKPEILAKFIQRSTSEELEMIIRVNQQAQEIIFENCTPRVKEIVSDSLNSPSKPQPDQIGAYLKTARNKLDQMIQNKEFEVSDLYKKMPDKDSVDLSKVA